MSADIPLLIGTTETEVTFFPNQVLDPIDDAGLHTHVKQTLRNASDAKVDEVIAAYRKGRPGVANTDLYLALASDATFRAGVVLEAERKAAQKARCISITSPGNRRSRTASCGVPHSGNSIRLRQCGRGEVHDR